MAREGDNTNVVAELRYDPEGLRAFVAACEVHATNVCAHEQPELPQAAHQSTIAAVSGLYTATSTVGEVLAQRIRSTASAVSSAADGYTRTDDAAADALAARIHDDMQ